MNLTRPQFMHFVSSFFLLTLSAGLAPAQESGDSTQPIELYGSFSSLQVQTVSHSGAAVASIPILVPPGRAGLAPVRRNRD